MALRAGISGSTRDIISPPTSVNLNAKVCRPVSTIQTSNEYSFRCGRHFSIRNRPGHEIAYVGVPQTSLLNELREQGQGCPRSNGRFFALWLAAIAVALMGFFTASIRNDAGVPHTANGQSLARTYDSCFRAPPNALPGKLHAFSRLPRQARYHTETATAAVA